MIDIFNNKHMMIFENSIHWHVYKYLEIFLPFIANLKCTPSDGWMRPSLGTSILIKLAANIISKILRL